MKKLKIGLLGKILIAIALGIGVGLIAQPWMVRTMLTFNGIFSEFLGFAIPLIILGLVTPAISDIGKTAGKMLLITVAIAYGSTVLSGLLSYFTGALAKSKASPASLRYLISSISNSPFLYNLKNILYDIIHNFSLYIISHISS